MALTKTNLANIVEGILPVANGGTGVTTSTGSGNTVLSASPTFTGTVVAPTINAGAATALTLQSAGTTAVTVDTSQNVGVGVTTPSFKTEIVGGATTVETTLLQIRSNFTGLNTGTTIALANSTNPTAGSGRVELAGLRDTASGSSFAIRTADSGGTIAERMRIDTSGNLLIGATATISGAKMVLEGSVSDNLARFRNTNAAPYGLQITYTTATPNNTTQGFLECYDATAQRATIRSNGGIANYSANNVNLSDAREKTNIELAGNYLNKICAIPVKTFLYNDQTDTDLNLGVIAQDVQSVAPELVMESNWGTEEDPKMRLSIYQTDLQYALMKAIQELKAEFDAYKAKHP